MAAAASWDPALVSSAPSHNRFAQNLQRLLRRPFPGCILVQATSPSDQVTALEQLRSLTSSPSAEHVTAEYHPNLLGPRAIDIRRDLETAFNVVEQVPLRVEAQDTILASSSKTSSTSSSFSIFPQESPQLQGTSASRLLVLPSAHLLRSTHPPLLWSQFLNPPEGYTVLMISSLPLDRWRTADAVEDFSGTRPIVRLTFRGVDLVELDARDNNKDHIKHLLLKALPQVKGEAISSPKERFKPLFVEYVFSSLSSEVGSQEIEELHFLSGAIWLALGRLVTNETGDDQRAIDAKYKDRHALLSLLGPLVRGALRDLLPRTVGLSQWISDLVEPARTSSVEKDRRRTAPCTVPLPPLASLLLISAFLASHLPPRTDTRYFLRDSSLISSLARPSKKVRRSKKRSKNGAGLDDELDSQGINTNSDPLLLGPKPFGLQRMLYIFENLCTELDVALPSFQGEMLAKRKRRQREEEEEEGEDRGRRLFTGNLNVQEEEYRGGKVDISSLTVQRTLLSLVQASYLLFVGPPFSGSPAFSSAGGSHDFEFRLGGSATPSLPHVPSKVEAVTQVTMRCNILKEELRTLVLGEGERHSGEQPTAPTDGARKEWWTRLEECGL